MATMENGAVEAPTNKSKKTAVEEIYQKKSQLEHILLRPDTYIGSVEPVTENMWVYDTEENSMVQREITYVPGLYKIFDEILVNAADNKQRDPTMDTIKVDINKEDNIISVWNNGQGIPVVEHKDEKMYVPTMIFGHLLTSSNYNDEEAKVTGGRNGFGAKLCNIFSNKFTVETASREYHKAFKQTWANNMAKSSDPSIKEVKTNDFTKVTFSPDLEKFKMTCLDKDIVDLMSRRAYDVAASTRGVKVYLNGKLLPVKSFQDYVNLYIKGKEDEIGNPLKVVYENAGARWEVAVTLSDTGFKQVSFVNSIATTKGGRHVDYITDMIVKQLIDIVKKRNKGGMDLKNHQVKNHLWVFVNCLIVNPTFDSQTKEHMTLQVKSFGSKCSLSEKFVTGVSKCGVVEAVLSWAKFKAQTQLQKQSGKKQSKLKGVPKLEDANDAGTKNSIDCTLILTEGDSAKSLAVSGLGVVGRDKYGVFPLRGKLLNVREASHKQIMENAEINNIVKIVGLQYKKKYETMEDLKTLRYGRLMIMTDQDQDGSHIKGLIINFIHHNWPSLLKLPFLEEFITPIVKATKGKEELSFYSLPEFEEWKEATRNWNKYKIKYYKGLGTSTSKEAKEYFQNMRRHRILFKYEGTHDDEHIEMAFSKKMVDARKEWLTNWMVESKRRKEAGLAEEYLYEKNTRAVTYKDFVNKELVLFSNMDNERSIASVVDGLKPGSRKVLFTCLKRNDKREIKVAQLAGSVAEHSAYHHGETSLMSTIVNLAQNYVGSNNINLLQPIGQFGTRLQGGKDAASPRYIFTMLSPLTRLIFHPHDDPLLTYLRDDNQKIEPVWYMPIIPMVLINGAEGIGTGWMTKIPNHNPREVVENLRRMIRGEEPLPMKPWYKNFIGHIEKLSDHKFISSGEVGIIRDNKVEITELPVGVWTQNYKESVLETMLADSEKSPAVITDYKEYNTDTTIKFVVSMNPQKLQKAENEGIHKFFKLHSSLSLTSMCAFDKDCVLKKYDSSLQIMHEFYSVRLEFYGKRKAYLEGMLGAEAAKLTNQARFIVEKCDGDLRIENRKKSEMVKELVRRGYNSDPVKAWKLIQDRESVLEDEAAQAAEETEEDESIPSVSNASTKDDDLDFDYLLGMSFWHLTLEKKNELLRKKEEKCTELDILKKKTPSDLWTEDLDAFLEKLEEVEEKERQEEAGEGKFKTGPKSSKLPAVGKKKLLLAADSLPSPAARRIIPKIDAEMLKKEEKLIAAKENKGKRAEKKKKGEEIGEDGEVIKKEKKEPKEKKEKVPRKKTDGLKQTKLKFSKKDSGDEDDNGNLSDSPPPPPRTVSKRQAAANVSFKFDDQSGDEDDPGNKSDHSANSFKTSPMRDVFSDELMSDDDDFIPKKKKESPKKAPKKEPAPKKASTKKNGPGITTSSPNSKPPTKKAPAKKQPAIEISDDDSDIPVSKPEKKPRAAASKPKRKYSSSDDSDDIFKSPNNSNNKPQKSFDDLFGESNLKKQASDDDDDFIMSNESDDEFVPKSKTAKKKAPAKTTTKKPPAKKVKAKSSFHSDSD
ncbi:DNA topoisomerase 2 isoform X2 [Daktulosphaira vitifoliae]|nr:DNA topoisomerase 2 isoform X2 [Daktulosphaira vitifoliae]XP_050533098.1 DNA topoisomerase 2 isoform X2 [Daktulosphaira vitifoliae]XP_050533107.1 DNA topoisomerase 2 isoform X2 [Daktulosphaira vitifoliae]XP_050533116.1 DNA topoisomerase 2 isoform X2 [Daktulosphaira vitifoliae]